MSDTRTLEEFDRAQPLNTDAREQIKKLIPPGAELVEGDFADDEKWRVTYPETIGATGTIDVELDSPVIGNCHGCGGEIREHEPRVEDKRGLHHDGCYVQPKKR
jgi:hypothetical protein